VGFPATTGEPPKQLKGFQKVWLQPGQSKQVTIPLDSRSFSYWDPAAQKWVVAPGTYRILVGGSSRDIRLTGSVKPHR
jgi:beta-glucosidase